MIRNTHSHLIEEADANGKLDHLLDRVEKGESFVIARHGLPIARLVPYGEPIDAALVERAIHEVEKLRKGVKLGGVSVRELIEEGRRM
jgi:prevent-host-death family protein